MGKLQETNHKTSGHRRENLRKLQGKPWDSRGNLEETNGQALGNQWESLRKPVGKPKEATRRELVEVLLEAAATRKLAPATASKYRGKSTWVGSHLMGRLGRVGQAALKQQQYGSQSTLDEVACRQKGGCSTLQPGSPDQEPRFDLVH